MMFKFLFFSSVFQCVGNKRHSTKTAERKKEGERGREKAHAKGEELRMLR